MSAGLFTIGIAARAALVGASVFAVIELLATQRLFATALVAAAIGALVLLDLNRYVSKGDRMLAQFIDGFTAGDFERPARDMAASRGFRHLTSAIERALTALSSGRTSQQQQIDSLQALIDTAYAAIFIVEHDGSVTLANRAARQLAKHPISRLDQVQAFGPSVASELMALAPAQRAIVRLTNGHRVLASAAQLATAGVGRRVLSLQNIASELDAVELQAWHDLVRILAHEMMNSLTPIVSLAESVRPLVADMRAVAAERANDDPRAQDIASAIDAIARRSTGLMSFVERYRKMAERPQPVPRPVRLAELLQKIEQLMSAMLVRKAITYSSCVEPSHLEIRADAEMLEQALLNLVHNAADALTTTEHPRIEVRCQIENGWVAISVLDNGPGMDANVVERIFVPFFTTKPGGSGIGLSLARQIAHAHGGRLEASGNTPTGAVFTLLVPAQQVPH